jgi:hypothetical protein
MPPQNPDDLSKLIDSASREVTASASRTAAARARRERSERAPVLPALAGAVALAAVAYLGHALWQNHAPPADERVAQDLEQVVDMARASVEEAKASTGALPAALPNASLAAVVRYEPQSNQYKLVATMMGVRVTLQQDGSKKTDKGVLE